VPAKAGTITDDVFAIAQTADLLLEQACELFLPLDERQSRRALPIQEQEIEGEEHELICPSLIHRCLEPTEHRHAVSIQRAQLAVEIG
jgi:hypothetical protein